MLSGSSCSTRTRTATGKRHTSWPTRTVNSFPCGAESMSVPDGIHPDYYRVFFITFSTSSSSFLVTNQNSSRGSITKMNKRMSLNFIRYSQATQAESETCNLTFLLFLAFTFGKSPLNSTSVIALYNLLFVLIKPLVLRLNPLRFPCRLD
jgi:hypothetical protein